MESKIQYLRRVQRWAMTFLTLAVVVCVRVLIDTKPTLDVWFIRAGSAWVVVFCGPFLLSVLYYMLRDYWWRED